MHPLLNSPARRVLTSPGRLPMPQDPTRVIADNLQQTLMDRDSLRRIKTTARNRICSSPLSSPQTFTRPDGGVNTAPQMAAGAHKMNARRLVSKTRGQSAGM